MALLLWVRQREGASIAVNFIPNKLSPALSLSVDCLMLFGIEGQQQQVQSIVGIAGTAFTGKVVGRCLNTLSHLLWLVFLSIAVNFIPNKQSPALSLSVDSPMLFGIKGLQECSRLLESLEDGTAFAGKAAGRCLHTLSHLLWLVFVSFASHIILRLVFSSGRFILLVEEL